jgi:hypothetical protein
VKDEEKRFHQFWSINCKYHREGKNLPPPPCAIRLKVLVFVKDKQMLKKIFSHVYHDFEIRIQ